MKHKIMPLAASVLAVALLFALLADCGGKPAPSEDGNGISVVTTVFPLYDWTRELLGGETENVSLTMLLDSGVDLHSYQPTAADILKISTCDLFIYVGGESDAWVDDALGAAVNENMIVIDLLDELGAMAKTEELVEGMQGEEEEGEEEGPAYDEHIWLSLRNAEYLCGRIADALQSVDPEHAEEYAGNATDYAARLSALDALYTQAVSEGSADTLLFGDRFPFRYMTDDYGLNYYAAFSGCSAETEASFETVLFLAGKLDELSLSHVMTLEGTDHRLAETIVENSTAKDQTILVLDSMQSITAQNVAQGVTYLTVMEKNLDVLKQALA